jgi:hypothetical protein
MGEPVTAIGAAVGVLTDTEREILRLFRGFVQRPFLYAGRLGHEYPAYELSFPVPPGLSGAPIFADDDSKLLCAVVTENFKSYTVVESEETMERPGEFRRTESREIITYGVAASAFNGLEFFEDAIPVGNLNAADEVS